jgi:hypothetical protein
MCQVCVSLVRLWSPSGAHTHAQLMPHSRQQPVLDNPVASNKIRDRGKITLDRSYYQAGRQNETSARRLSHRGQKGHSRRCQP